MAVCRLAILSFIRNEDLGGYDIHDLKDCIAFGQDQLELGITTGFDGQDWKCFIKWAKHKIKEMQKEE
jgi:hypothetical protein